MQQTTGTDSRWRWRRAALGAIATVVAGLSLFAGAGERVDAAGTVTVAPSNGNGWGFLEETANGSGQFVTGPGTAPLGIGSAELTVDSIGREILASLGFTGTRLDDITNLEYSSYRATADSGNLLAISLQLDVDYDSTDANTAWQGRLVFEPYFTIGSGNVPEDTWQTWSPLTGKWWASGAPGNTTCPHSAPCTWAQVLAAFPDAGIRGAVNFRAGGPWAGGFTGNVDDFLIGINGDNTTFDFDPDQCSAVCYVDDSGSDSHTGLSPAEAKQTIQAAIDQVAPGGEVRVLPGNYSEAATNRYVLAPSGQGPHQFGLFVPHTKAGISVVGVDGSDVPVSSAGAVLADVELNATNNFGPSGMFVEADGVTVSGLKLHQNEGLGSNKTVEVIGDAFTLVDSYLTHSEWGSVYINDWQFDELTDTSHLQSYTIADNILERTSIDLNSGAGYSGPVSGRVISGNTITSPLGNPATVSFSGSGTCVPWFVYGVGGAVVTGNTFSGGTQYIRARGDYDNSQFDWASYWNDNTFDRAVAVGANPPSDIREYSYPVYCGNMEHVRRIGAVIQDEIDHAAPGDTVLVKEGTYAEQIDIPTSIQLIGEGSSKPIIVPPGPLSGDKNLVTIRGAGVSVEVSNLTISGPGAGSCGSIMAGIFVRDGAYAHIHRNEILEIRDNPFSGCQNGLGILIGRNFAGTSGTALIEDNLITGYQKGGIVVDGPSSFAEILDNEILGDGATPSIAQNGIQVSRDATASIKGNHVEDAWYAGANWTSTGILIFQTDDVIVQGNAVVNSQVGIGIESWCWGGFASADGNQVTNNQIDGSDWGVTIIAYDFPGYSQCDASANKNKVINNT
ncbi:MAG TPA: right-handed parallel beta-helix repeat-containing protein, partial [Tepidiformaceae bacterium]|nr:right-handed parallel beta-helix repeat-containing protein [Tepidiformaceae bacterium]